MKTMRYAVSDTGDLEVYRHDGKENGYITISSDSTPDPDDIRCSIVIDTFDWPLGPCDDSEEDEELRDRCVDLVIANWNSLEEMSKEEASERINNLAAEWKVAPEELEYLV